MKYQLAEIEKKVKDLPDDFEESLREAKQMVESLREVKQMKVVEEEGELVAVFVTEIGELRIYLGSQGRSR